jgi:hypothetical protein
MNKLSDGDYSTLSFLMRAVSFAPEMTLDYILALRTPTLGAISDFEERPAFSEHLNILKETFKEVKFKINSSFDVLVLIQALDEKAEGGVLLSSLLLAATAERLATIGRGNGRDKEEWALTHKINSYRSPITV